MKILITGGGGFLGSHLTEKFLSDGHQVVAVDNFATGLKSNKGYLEKLSNSKDLTFLEEDVVQPWESWSSGSIFKRLPKCNYIFHFASPASPPHYQRLGLETMWVNSVGLSHALNFADKTGARVIFASTSEIYGDPSLHPQPESYWGNVNTFGPRACYDESKRFGEALIYTHNLKHKTQHGLVRIFNTYGPRMNPNDGRVIINFLIQAIQGKDLTVYGDGSQSRSFCYVDDLISAIWAYAQTRICEPLNIGNDKEFTILEAAEIVQKIFKEKNLKINFEPIPKDDPKQRRPDLSRTKKLLSPWQPTVDLQTGLLMVKSWLEQELLSARGFNTI